jgi:hypothetical protein
VAKADMMVARERLGVRCVEEKDVYSFFSFFGFFFLFVFFKTGSLCIALAVLELTL